MSKPLKFGIIGTGAIAEKHASAINELHSTELVAVCSSSAKRAKQAEREFHVKGYDSLEEFLAHPGLEVVCICTASGQHLEPTVKAAQAGKHVLVEKPIEISIDRADAMIQACEQHQVKLGVIFQNRFNEGYLLLHAAVKSGQLGKLLMGNAYIKWFRDREYYQSSHWKGTFSGDGGGAFINQGIHTVDLLLDIMGEAESVFGKVKTALYDIEGEDMGTALVTFRNGALGNITAGTALYPGYPERLEIYGTEGSVMLEGGKIVAWNVKNQASKVENPTHEASGAADPMAIGHALHLMQIEDMVMAIQENKPPLVTGAIAKKSLEVILGIYESSKTGNEIAL
ncbi:gfo/Idh/MocA family oxidoreductase [Echinicola strongylocentroti]|uniref:Gfo/Idh/MocA family oxidoreductase n=1 Tax=Echinicola strongylocentroti TaxID=1795355 RepID=A0A2Z4INH7_9BACT|nr:Gfo/Idh/MocA family oxidoreductase [Echinicola strongylocentroti]AWW32661.1 gfo/Idh/MocA family oxidoreductase [Echinicola strongylocentroti]